MGIGTAGWINSHIIKLIHIIDVFYIVFFKDGSLDCLFFVIHGYPPLLTSIYV